jgi:hypothetical protein
MPYSRECLFAITHVDTRIFNDTLARPVAATLGAATSAYLFDHLNPVVISSGASSAQMFGGRGLQEVDAQRVGAPRSRLWGRAAQRRCRRRKV